MKFALILLGVSCTAFAATDPYRLVQMENDDFRDWTFAEMQGRMGADASLLPAYACDGHREYELLPEPPRKNPKGDSLRIRPAGATTDADDVVYRSGALYPVDAGASASLADAFVKKAQKSIAKLETLASGQAMLRQLEFARFPLVITSGRSGFVSVVNGKPNIGVQIQSSLQYLKTLRAPDYASIPFNQIGIGGYIGWNPDLAAQFIESDGKKRAAQPHVVLAHEMFHAFDGIRGLIDRRFVEGKGYESTEATEYRAVFFENTIRRESGLRYRKYYGSDVDPNGGVLDSTGQPRLIPSVCL